MLAYPATTLMVAALMMSVSLFTSLPSAHAFKPRYLPFQKGINLTSWGANGYPKAATEKTLRQFKKNRVKWVTLLQTWNQKNLTSNRVYRGRQTVKDANLIHAINYAHKIGLKVLLRPYVDVEKGLWRGEIKASNPPQWFKSYGNFALHYAKLAKRYRVGAFIFASEMGVMSLKYQRGWRGLASRVRKAYPGPVGYEANWNELLGSSWMSSVDFIGLSAYNPICDKSTTHLPRLEAGWKKWIKDMRSIVTRNKRPIIFSEVGYRPLSSTCTAPWDTFWLRGNYSPYAQAQAYLATFRVWWPVRWFRGMHWWAANPTGIRKYPEDHDPRGKAWQVIRTWYGKRAAGQS